MSVFTLMLAVALARPNVGRVLNPSAAAERPPSAADGLRTRPTLNSVTTASATTQQTAAPVASSVISSRRADAMVSTGATNATATAAGAKAISARASDAS